MERVVETAVARIRQIILGISSTKRIMSEKLIFLDRDQSWKVHVLDVSLI